MSRANKSQRPAPDPIKETTRMPKRLARLAALIGATFALLIVPSVASAASPWWQVLDGSRPTNMWEPQDQGAVQKLEAEMQFGIFVAGIEVGGEMVGCLGAGEVGGFTADQKCQEETPFGADETAAELQATLEVAYGGTVEVSGGPVGIAPFEVTTPGRWVQALKLKVFNFSEAFPVPLGVAQTGVLSKDSGRLILTFTNLGDAPVDATKTPVRIVDELPEGVTAWKAEAVAGDRGKAGPVDCSIDAPEEVSCVYGDVLPSYEAIEVEISTVLPGSPPIAGQPGAAPGKVSVSGGNAPSASGVQTIKVSPEKTPFGIERFSSQSEEEGGSVARKAGGHPFQFTTTLQLNAGAVVGATRRDSYTEQPAMPRNLRFPLPAGFVGNATVMPRCEMAVFLTKNADGTNDCPDESAIGVSSVTIVEPAAVGLARLAVPVFNLPQAPGEPARFGLMPLGDPVIIDTSLDPDDDYRITASVVNTTQLPQFLSTTTSLWGTPGDPRHDNSRGWGCLEPKVGPCVRPSGMPEAAFLRQPVNCNTPLDFGLEVEPWNVPTGSILDKASFTGEPLLGCNKVPFDPKIVVSPTSKAAENPSGLHFELTMPNAGLLNGEAISEGQPKKAEVILPEGMTVNPSAAEGLATCSPADYAREKFNSKPGEGCPEASKVGNVSVKTPLIEESVDGALYVATPYENPFNSLFALYIVAKAPASGVLAKLPLGVSPDPDTGRLVATVKDAPQMPIESFEVNFREGVRSLLVTPPACGTYATAARFTPWSAQDPDNPAPSEVVTRTSEFKIERGVDGGACPPGGIPPFRPDFQAGAVNNDAGAFSPFDMRVTRKDGEQDMTKFSAILPPGELGSLAGVDKCPDSAIATAKAKTGKEELASPSCPSNSLIGHTLAGAGVGNSLTYVKGQVYLGGPYHGDPLSVIAITPGVAGPFDAGTIVVQEALTLNPKTAEVEVDGAASDPIPHIIKGIVLKLRDLRIYVDRPNFTLNPTSCEESSARSVLFGSYLNVLSPADDKSVDLQTRYQAANCLNLGFKPDLKLSLKGGTKRGGHPGLTATYTPRKGDANIKGLVARLPRSAFLDQAHIRTICTRVQFAAKACPKGAQYGYIKAWTPLLDTPLEGPVWLRSSNHKLPDLVFDLHGLVDIEVDVRIDSKGGGIRASLEDSPDAPLSKVVLKMQGAKKGLIVNSRNLCGSTNRANIGFEGQNGKEAKANPVMKADCGGKRKHKRQKSK
jgi:hypothetical protein